MGIVRKQSIQSSVAQYLGAGLGFVNRTFVLTQFLEPNQVGIISFLLANAMVFSQFGSFGLPFTTLKFFPFFRSKARSHHGFLRILIGGSLLGFVFVTLNYVLFKPWIAGYFATNSPEVLPYYYYLIPLGFFAIFYEVMDSYLRSLFKTVVPVFIREIGQRAVILLVTLVYAVGWIDFETYVIIFVIAVSSLTLVLVGYVMFLGQFNLRQRTGWRIRNLRSRMYRYAGFIYLSGVSTLLIFTIDQWMLGGMKGMAEVGIYTTLFYVTSFIIVPWKALVKITQPILADHWARRDLPAIQTLYQRTSLINLLAGGFLYLGLFINAGNLFDLLRPEYVAGFYTLVYVGLTRVMNMVSGLNTYILMNSDKYVWDLLIVGATLVIAVVSNQMLIPEYGITGASIATLFTFGFINITRSIFVYAAYRLHPLSWKMLLVLLIAGVSFLFQYMIPSLGYWLLDALVRSIVFTIVYGGLTLLLRPVPDVDALVQLIRKKLTGRNEKK